MNSSDIIHTCGYEALPSIRSIRLLNLQASPDGKIETTLHIHSLDNAPAFRALSYTWGKPYRDPCREHIEEPPEFIETISCNDEQVAVTQNLFDALSTFVELDMTGFLWVDAICINQADLEERASQVSLMGDIYSTAHEVLVWLGPHEEGVEDFLWATTDFLDLIKNPDLNRTPKDIFGPGNIPSREFWSSLGLEDPLPRLLKFAFLFSSCQWFTRAWTIQEVIQAQQVRMFLGENELSFQNATELYSLLRKLDWDRELLTHLLEVDRSFPTTNCLQKLGFLSYIGILFSDPWTAFKSWQSRWRHGAETTWILSSLLFACRSYKCQDKRDMIYSVLGMVEKTFTNNHRVKQMIPDYTKNIEKVFMDTSVLILSHSKTLDWIADTRHRVHGGAQIDKLNLPSWVHDYSSPFQAYPLAEFNLQFDAALCHTSSFPDFTIDGSAINCYGAYFDTIGEIQGSSFGSTDGQVLQLILDLLKIYLAQSHHIQGRRRLEVFWRTLLFDCIETADAQPPPSLEISFLAWMKSSLWEIIWKCKDEERDKLTQVDSILEQFQINGSPDEQAIVQEVLDLGYLHDTQSLHNYIPMADATVIHEKMRSVAFNSSKYDVLLGSSPVRERRLFITKKGFLGLGVETVQKGDQVWLLCDAHTPFVMRATPEPSSFTVVGDCYIHDFMHGEMLEDRWGVKKNIGPIKIV